MDSRPRTLHNDEGRCLIYQYFPETTLLDLDVVKELKEVQDELLLRGYATETDHFSTETYLERNHAKIIPGVELMVKRVTRDVSLLMRSVTYANEQIQDWITCPLSEFRSEAVREAGRVEADRENEASRLKVPLSSIPQVNEDFMEDFIPTRLLMIANVMQNLGAACSSYLQSSAEIWKQIELEIGNTKPKHITITKFRQYLEDVLSTDQVKHYRREATLQRFHDDALTVVFHPYRRRRQDLEILVAQIKEWQGRWMCEQEPEPADTPPSSKTKKQCQPRSPVPPAVPSPQTKKVTKPRSSKKPTSGAEYRKQLMASVASVVSRQNPNSDYATGMSPSNKPQWTTTEIDTRNQNLSLGERSSRERSSTSELVPPPGESGHKNPKGFLQSAKFETPAPRLIKVGPSAKKAGARLSSERGNISPSNAAMRQSFMSTKSNKHGSKVETDEKSGDKSEAAALPTKTVKDGSNASSEDDSDNEFLIDI